jgi:pilus assembly protein CpaE
MANSESIQFGEAWKALILCPDQGMLAELMALLARESRGFSAIELRSYPGRRDLAEMLADQPPEICFLDVVSDREKALSLLAPIAEAVPRASIVSLLGGADSDLILASLRQGASEFLVRPFTADQLQPVLTRIAKLRSAARNGGRASGTVYCIMPGKGGCGATTVACNLACHFKRSGMDKVLLADLDPLTGTVSFLLKLKSHYSFVDALSHAADLDGDLWKNLVTACQAGDVILPPQNPVDAIAEARDASPIIHYSRQHYQKVILDSNGPYGEWNTMLARLCDKLLLVSTNELPALHATRRALAWLETQGVERSKVGMIINRYRRDVGLTREEIESVIQTEILSVIPSDYQTMQKALMDGKPAPPASSFGKSLRDLAARLDGHAAPDTKVRRPGWLDSLFGRKRVSGQ